MSLLQLDRPEFLDHYFDYRRGEHAAWIYPTGRGKSTLAYQCADVAMRQNPDLTFCSLVPKAKSPTTAQWARTLELQETPTWPPRKRLFAAEPRGYALWPKHRKDLTAAANRAQLAEHFRKALHDLLWQGDCIVFGDDLHRLAVLLGLNTELEEIWTTGAEAGCGGWGANQKPSGTVNSGAVSSFFYNSPSHMFFGRDSDQRNIRRFSEIGGGINPREIAYHVQRLRLFPINGKVISEVLYLDTRGPFMALVGPL